MKDNIAVLILAAGASSRMGRPKALLPWRGTTMLGHLIGQVEQAGLTRIIAVTGASHKEIQGLAGLGAAHICENQGWAGGMGTSIRAGLECVGQRFPATCGILILLADQPLIDAVYLEALCRAFARNPEGVTASRYGASCGVPALFGRPFFESLRQIPPESGAKALIAGAADRRTCLEPGRMGCDIDTPEQYETLIKSTEPETQN